MKLAVIGGGPSAFYVVSRVLSLLPPEIAPALRIHVYDRLWAPHGLVRYGVAPDHPEVKNCTHKFDDAAGDRRFRFFGNVNVGGKPATKNIPHAVQLPFQSLFKNYTHLLLATGCALPKLHQALPPSQYCIPALSLVHWYTKHPFNTPAPPLDKVTHVSLIGNGNVSMDIARMLLVAPQEHLARHDIPASVFDVLSRSSVQHVSIFARRGPLEAAFTTKELRELMNLPDASMVPLDPAVLTPGAGTTLTRQQSRSLQLLQKGSKNPPGSTRKTWSLDFFRSPTGLSLEPTPRLALAHTAVDPATKRAVPTGETSIVDTSLVVTSLGFQAEHTLPWFDAATGHLATRSGGRLARHVYASGWAANGARGVLASTMLDAYAVADTIVSDLMPRDAAIATTAVSELAEEGQSEMDDVMCRDPNPEDPPAEIREALVAGDVFEYDQWKTIDAEEVRRGAETGKERERMNFDEARRFLARVEP